MTSKTFKSAAGRTLTIEPSDGRNILFATAGSFMALKMEEAPAIALAVLEAAGWPNEHLATTEILRRLREFDEHVKAVEAEAREHAELEAEALELMNVRLRASGTTVHLTKATVDPVALEGWLAVARRAREIAKEATK